MAQTIKLRRSASQSAVPTTSALALGEMAINTFDGKIFIKRDNGTDAANVIDIGYDKLPLSGGALTGALTTNSTIDGRDVAADGVLATAALPKTGGAMTGAITTNSTFDGVDIATRDAILTSTTTTAGAALPKAGGTMTGNLTVSIPDGGGSPAMTSVFNLWGYGGRGTGIKFRDQKTSASGSSNREWFIGSGYNQNGFNIGYSSTGSQSSYLAQNKLNIDTSGNATFAGAITSASKDVGTQSVVTTAPTSGAGFPTGHVWYVI